MDYTSISNVLCRYCILHTGIYFLLVLILKKSYYRCVQIVYLKILDKSSMEDKLLRQPYCG